MKLSREILDRANKAGKGRRSYLQLGIRQEGGGVKSTGKHIFTVVKEVGIIKVDNPQTGAPEDRLQLLVSEDGVEKIWNVPIKDKQGNLHYLIPTLAGVEEGDEMEAEMKKRGLKNYIALNKVGEGEVIHQDENEDNESPDRGREEKTFQPDFSGEESSF